MLRALLQPSIAIVAAVLSVCYRIDGIVAKLEGYLYSVGDRATPLGVLLDMG